MNALLLAVLSQLIVPPVRVYFHLHQQAALHAALSVVTNCARGEILQILSKSVAYGWELVCLEANVIMGRKEYDLVDSWPDAH